MKPVNEPKLREVLGRAAKNMEKTLTALFLPAENGQVRVLAGEIMYIESSAHFSEVTTVSGAYKVKLHISELERQLDEKFVKCHRSYIVGLKYVDKITKTDIILDNGAAVPLSRRLYGEVNKALIKYFTKE